MSILSAPFVTSVSSTPASANPASGNPASANPASANPASANPASANPASVSPASGTLVLANPGPAEPGAADLADAAPPAVSGAPVAVVTPLVAALLDLLRPRLDFSTFEWLRASVHALVAPLDVRELRAAFARAGRKLGSYPVNPAPHEVISLRDEVGLWPLVGWGADEIGRAALLAQGLAAAAPETHEALVEGIYQRGTIRERQAVLRILAWLPEPERFAGVAAQACRSHVPTVFEAIALANPYPSRYLSPPLFEQMVAKAIATRASPERILGLANRVSAGGERARAFLLPPIDAPLSAHA